MRNPVKVIDLFAGPGGLGEGFSDFRVKSKQAFKISISIEKEESAHRTLLLRALFRQFSKNDVPEAYYAFLRGELGEHPEDKLYHLPELKEALRKARREAQQLTLGEDDPRTIYGRIRDVIGRDECILIGGPPCQAYSVVGRARNYGAKDKTYSATEDHRNFLYLEYLKVISKFQPKAFVMENVKGMLTAKVDGKPIFESIHRDLQDPYKSTKIEPDSGRSKHHYKIFSFVPRTGNLDLIENSEDSLDPHDFIIKTENYGIPQSRHRVILLGIRDDITSGLSNFQQLKLSDEQPSVRQVISDLPKLRSKLSKGVDSKDNWREAIYNISNSTLNQVAEDIHVPDKVYEDFIEQLNKIWNSPTSVGADKGLVKKSTDLHKRLPNKLKTWYKDKRLGDYVVNHASRSHIAGDLHRYLYYSTYAKK